MRAATGATCAITNAGFADEHVAKLVEPFAHSECNLTELDLSLNMLLDFTRGLYDQMTA